MKKVLRDKIKKFLEKEEYPDFVVEASINSLVDGWDYVVKNDLENPDYIIEEYLNDLDGRATIAKILDAFHDPELDTIRRKIELIDTKFRKLTKPSSCVWGKNVETMRYFNSKDHWWYYRLPKLGQFKEF